MTSTAKVTVAGVTVELSDAQARAAELGDKAMAMLAAAVELTEVLPPGGATGLRTDLRTTPGHRDVRAGRGRVGFAPVHAETAPTAAPNLETE